jgi:hypothetical protein
MKPYIPIESKKQIADLESAETTNKHRLAITGTKKGWWRKKRLIKINPSNVKL